MRINHNIAALNTYRQLTANNNVQQRSLARLSSGFRINSAADDAAGLAISEKMRGQIRGLEQATRNAQDGISLIQTAEGALNETHSVLQRMRELAVQSANDTNTLTDRAEIQKEVDELAKELTRIANTTEFNTQNLLNGGIQTGNLGELTFHIGANASQDISLGINAMDASTLGVARDVTTLELSGATDVTAAEVEGTTGSAVVDGATLNLTANDTASTATTGNVGGITLTTDSNTSELNGVNISYANGGDGSAVSVTYDSATKTFQITGDFDDTDSGGNFSTAADIQAELNTALSNNGFSATVTATGTADASTGGNSGAFTGGLGDDEVELTLSNGSITESLIVKDTATSAEFTDPSAYDGIKLTLDGSLSASTAATITVSVNTSSAATFSGGKLTAEAVAAGGIDVSSQTAADAAVATIQEAIETVSAERSKLGAYQNRLEHTINNLGTSAENLTASESRIRDVDMAKEMMEFTKLNILSQAAQAMLAQANQLPQSVLQLLR